MYRLAALALLLVTAGCDSGDDDLSRVEGSYGLETLTFDPSTTGLDDADVAARLDLTATAVEIFSDGDPSLLRVRYLDNTGSRRVNLRTTVSGDRVRFEAVEDDDREDLAALLLPSTFTLEFAGDNPRVLEGTFSVTGVNLEAFDPTLYEDQVGNRGTIEVSFRR